MIKLQRSLRVLDRNQKLKHEELEGEEYRLSSSGQGQTLKLIDRRPFIGQSQDSA